MGAAVTASTSDSAAIEARRTEEFLDVFFGPGNTIWVDRHLDSPAGRQLRPYLRALREPGQIPIILPRRKPDGDQYTTYVIPRIRAHARLAKDVVTAFVGYHYSNYPAGGAALDPADPIDDAVLKYAGHDDVFTLTSPTREHERACFSALKTMLETMRLRRGRTFTEPSRPVGRLIAEFDAALAAGDNSASAALYDQLTATGGLSAANLAHLRIKRLARLGRDSELLRLPELVDVVATDPPLPVKDAVLAAIYSTALAEPIASGDIDKAQNALIDVGSVVPWLAEARAGDLGTEALIVQLLAALTRDDTDQVEQLTAAESDRSRVAEIAPALSAILRSRGPEPPPKPPTEDRAVLPTTATRPQTWTELVRAVAEGSPVGREVLEAEDWRDWSPPAADDLAIGAVLDGLDDTASDRAWAVVGPFIDADGYMTPAPHSARAFLDHAFAHDRFRPADIAVLVALTDIVLRSGPGQSAYASLLEDHVAVHGQWVGSERAPMVLDMVDLLSRMPCPDPEARLRLAISLLTPLRDHQRRLDQDQREFARQLSDELQTQMSWPHEAATEPERREFRPASVLLYSLDEQVLARTAEQLSRIAPAISINLSHDKVGNSRLKLLARNADIVVLATRCATHAATGFIRSNIKRATVVEADGSGSASLTRAAVAALTESS